MTEKKHSGARKMVVLVTCGVLMAAVLYSPRLSVFASELVSSFSTDSDIPRSDRIDDLFSEYQVASWDEMEDGTAVVRIQVPSDWPYRSTRAWLECTARLGPHKHEWSEEPFIIEPGDDITTAVDPPAIAYLHEKADTFLTTLYVRAYVSGVSGDLPAAFLAWPGGAESAAVVWTESQAISSAPYGLLDASLQSTAALALSSPSDFALPSFEGDGIMPRSDTGFTPISE